MAFGGSNVFELQLSLHGVSFANYVNAYLFPEDCLNIIHVGKIPTCLFYEDLQSMLTLTKGNPKMF